MYTLIHLQLVSDYHVKQAMHDLTGLDNARSECANYSGNKQLKADLSEEHEGLGLWCLAYIIQII